MSATRQILLALILGIAAGAAVHLFAPHSAAWLDADLLAPVGKIFLRLLEFVVVPMVFTALILSLTQVARGEVVSRYAGRLMVVYALGSAAALMIGMAVAHWVRPGIGVHDAARHVARAAPTASLVDWLVNLVPNNPFAALAQANLLQVILSAALLGVAMRALPAQSEPLVAVFESAYRVIVKVLEFALRFAPIGVFALIASVIATQGLDLLSKLAFYVAGLTLALALMALLYLAVLALTGARPVDFVRHFGESLSFALGTASSNATLPLALENAQAYGLPPVLASFALPFGTALKRDGAAVLQGFNALFVAQLFHIDVTASLVLSIFATGLLVSFSTAGVPGAGLVAMTTVLGAAGLPLEGVGVVAGVDRFTDGLRTALNVFGNLASAALLSRMEARRAGATAPAP